MEERLNLRSQTFFLKKGPKHYPKWQTGPTWHVVAHCDTDPKHALSSRETRPFPLNTIPRPPKKTNKIKTNDHINCKTEQTPALRKPPVVSDTPVGGLAQALPTIKVSTPMIVVTGAAGMGGGGNATG